MANWVWRIGDLAILIRIISDIQSSVSLSVAGERNSTQMGLRK